MVESILTPRSSTAVGALKKKIGWCAIIFGCLGVHKFMLGYKRAGWIMLAVGVLGWFPFAIPSLIVGAVGLIEGIIYLNKSDEDFARIYLEGKREWF